MPQAKFIQQTLGDVLCLPVSVAWVGSLAEALKHLIDLPVDLVLLDLVLPDSAGLDTFEAVRAARPDVPVIVLSGTGDEATSLQAVIGGAQDYLTKATVSPEVLTRSIRYALERHRNLAELRNLALRDELTGVHNRRGFFLYAEELLNAALGSSSRITALFVDLDGLKQVNDTYGHHEGDRALADVASVLQSTMRSADIIGRVGGDEFCAVLLDDGNDSNAGAVAAGRFQAAMDSHNATNCRPFELACTVGIAIRLPTAGLTIAELLARADLDMYDSRQARRLGDGRQRDLPSNGGGAQAAGRMTSVP